MDERKIEKIDLTISATDERGNTVAPTPPEQLQAAFMLLRRALDAPGMAAPLPDSLGLKGASAGQCVESGLHLILAGWQALDGKAKTLFAREAIALLKKFLPVRAEWKIFNDDGEDIGTVPQWISQREAEERFGL